MYRLVKSSRRVVDRCGGKNTYTSYALRSEVGKNVTEEVARYDNVELRRVSDKLHSHIVYEYVFEFYVSIVLMYVVYDCTPYARSLKHVCLVYGRNLMTSLLCKLKSYAADSFYFEFAVSHYVVAFSSHLALSDTFFTEVDTADKFSYNHKVDILGIFERAYVGECLKHFSGTEICIKSHSFSYAQKRTLGTGFVGKIVVLRSAYRAEKHAVALKTDI